MAEPCELANKPWGRAGVPQWVELWSNIPEALGSISNTTEAWHSCGILQFKHSRAAGWRMRRWSSSSASEIKASLGCKRPISLSCPHSCLNPTPRSWQEGSVNCENDSLLQHSSEYLNCFLAFFSAYRFQGERLIPEISQGWWGQHRFGVGKEAPWLPMVKETLQGRERALTFKKESRIQNKPTTTPPRNAHSCHVSAETSEETESSCWFANRGCARTQALRGCLFLIKSLANGLNGDLWSGLGLQTTKW